VLIETTRSGLRDGLEAARAEGKRIALVPTMGYLHEGHLSLVDHALRVSDVVVMSIFVNPLQFGPSEDLARYPRDLVRDSELAQKRGVDMIFAPSDEEMYEAGRPVVTIIAHAAAQRMEGEFRPGHFEGVLTVVAKLFNIVQPHVSIFGQKDFQQSVLIKRMCTDLDFPIRIDVAPTVREPDGLALSSRNVYLSASERQSALRISRALRAAQDLYANGERDPNALLQAARSVLAQDAAVHVQYIDLVDPRTLEQPAEVSADSVVAVAALVGRTRLIDNMIIGQ
jgi:pantoate--beta-alanine ligase